MVLSSSSSSSSSSPVSTVIQQDVRHQTRQAILDEQIDLNQQEPTEEDDLPTYQMSNIRRRYSTRNNPPFIQENMACPAGTHLSVLGPGSNGVATSDPNQAKTVDLVCREWVSGGLGRYWTVDHRGIRYIVKEFETHGVGRMGCIHFRVFWGFWEEHNRNDEYNHGFGEQTKYYLMYDKSNIDEWFTKDSVFPRLPGHPSGPTARSLRAARRQRAPASPDAPENVPTPTSRQLRPRRGVLASNTRPQDSPMVDLDTITDLPRHPRASQVVEDKKSIVISHTSTQQTFEMPAEFAARTVLQISQDGIDLGTVAVYLGSCPNINAFFDHVLTAWEIDEASIKVVTARAEWLKEGAAFVIRKALPDSYLHFLKSVGKADVWKENEGDEEKEFDVAVNIIMKG